MRALVTGCAGFIGSHLTERLLEEGWSVLGVDAFVPTYGTQRRRSWAASMPSTPYFEFLEADILDLDITPLLDGCDVVFHLAARPGVRAVATEFALPFVAFGRACLLGRFQSSCSWEHRGHTEGSRRLVPHVFDSPRLRVVIIGVWRIGDLSDD